MRPLTGTSSGPVLIEIPEVYARPQMAWHRLMQEDPFEPRVERILVHAMSMSTIVMNGPVHTVTSGPWGNSPAEIPLERLDLPYARNNRERRILEALGKGLRTTIMKAEIVLGRRKDAKDRAAWNHEFFELVSRPPARTVDGVRRRAR